MGNWYEVVVKGKLSVEFTTHTYALNQIELVKNLITLYGNNKEVKYFVKTVK